MGEAFRAPGGGLPQEARALLVPENIRTGVHIKGGGLDVRGTYVPTYGRFKINISGSSTVSADAFAATCARWQVMGGGETDAVVFTFLKSCYIIRETLTKMNAGNTLRLDLRIGTYYLPVFDPWD